MRYLWLQRLRQSVLLIGDREVWILEKSLRAWSCKLVEDDLRVGRLVAPFALRVKTSGGYYLAHHPSRPREPRIVAFEQWLLSEAALCETASRQANAIPEGVTATAT